MSNFWQKALGFVAAPVVGSLVASAARSQFKDANTRYGVTVLAHGATAAACYFGEGKVRGSTTKAVLHGGAWGEGINTGLQAAFGSAAIFGESTAATAPAAPGITAKINQALAYPEARVLLNRK